MPIQPSPMAETSRLLLPRLRVSTFFLLERSVSLQIRFKGRLAVSRLFRIYLFLAKVIAELRRSLASQCCTLEKTKWRRYVRLADRVRGQNIEGIVVKAFYQPPAMACTAAP